MAKRVSHQDFILLSIPWAGGDGLQHEEPCYIAFEPPFEPPPRPLVLEIANSEFGRRLASTTCAAPGSEPAPDVEPVRVGWQPPPQQTTWTRFVVLVVLAATVGAIAMRLGPPLTILPVTHERLAADRMIEGAVARYEQAVLDIRSAPNPHFDEMSEDVSRVCVKIGSPSMVFFGRDAELNETKGIELFDELRATLQGAYSRLAGSCEHLLRLLSHASYEHMALSRQLRADGDVFRTAVRGLEILEADLLAASQDGQSSDRVAGAISYNLSPWSGSQWPWAVASTRNTTDRLRRLAVEALGEADGRFGRLVDGALISVERAQSALGGCDLRRDWLAPICSPACCRQLGEQAHRLEGLRLGLARHSFAVRERLALLAEVIAAAEGAIAHLDGVTDEMGALVLALDSLRGSGWVVKTSSALIVWDVAPAAAVLETLHRVMAAMAQMGSAAVQDQSGTTA